MPRSRYRKKIEAAEFETNSTPPRKCEATQNKLRDALQH